MNAAFAKGLFKRFSIALQWGCAAGGAGFLFSFIYVAAKSMSYPFHLEWMEGQVIDVISRVTHGLPVYTEPSIDYVPFIYTPYISTFPLSCLIYRR